MARPFLKWAGGKSSSVEYIMDILPKDRTKYYESFLGGGAVFFALHKAGRIKEAVLSDTNEELIKTYKAVRDEIDDVVYHLKVLNKEYLEKDKEKYYYKVRSMDRSENFENLPLCAVAARMIFINKAGFNGLYRVNRAGYNNVPWGKKDKPSILDEENLRNASKALQIANIGVADFEQAAYGVDLDPKNSMFYFDPPYWPAKSGSFVSYNSHLFDSTDHVRLANVMEKLKRKGAFALQSNSDMPQVRKLNSKMAIKEIKASRRINSNPKGRGEVNELLIYTDINRNKS